MSGSVSKEKVEILYFLPVGFIRTTDGKFHLLYKIGSTYNFRKRMPTYFTTYDAEKIGKPLGTWIYEIINGYIITNTTAKEIDELIKKTPDRGFIRRCEDPIHGSTLPQETYIFPTGSDKSDPNPDFYIEKFLVKYGVTFTKLSRDQIKKLYCESIDKIKSDTKSHIYKELMSNPVTKYMLAENLDVTIKCFGELDLKLRDYQKQAHEKLITELIHTEKNIAQLIMPAGTGKTITVLSFIYNYRTVFGFRRVLIGVSSIAIRNQFKSEIFKFGTVFGFKSEAEVKFEIIMYEKSGSIVAQGNEYDLKIGDEAHHLTADSAKSRKGSKEYRQFHNIKSRKTIFMTATRKFIHDSKSLNDKLSMDNEKIFGKVVYEMSTKFAIDNKFITDFDIKLIKSNTTDWIDWCSDILSSYFIRGRHILVYMEEIFDIEELQKINPDVMMICGKTEDKERTEIIKKFKKLDTGIIATCNAISEGFDDCTIDTIVICKNTKSPIRIYQNLLRANRINPETPEKRALYIFNMTMDGYNKSVIKSVIDNINSDASISVTKSIAKSTQKIPEMQVNPSDVVHQKTPTFVVDDLIKYAKVDNMDELVSKLVKEFDNLSISTPDRKSKIAVSTKNKFLQTLEECNKKHFESKINYDISAGDNNSVHFIYGDKYQTISEDEYRSAEKNNTLEILALELLTSVSQ